MKLRRKMPLLIGATFFALFGILFYLSDIMLGTIVTNIERTDVGKNLERSQNAIEEELKSLGATARDWAEWDETYSFVQGRNREYVARNLDPASLSAIRVDAAMFFDSAGRVIDVTGRVPLDPAILEEARSQARTFGTDPTAGQVHGALVHGRNRLLAVSALIVNNDRSLPPRGTLVFGRYLDDAMVSSMAERLKVSLQVLPFREETLPPPLRARMPDAGQEGAILSYPVDGSRVAGYRPLMDNSGKPVLFLRVEVPRDAREAIRASQRSQVAGFVILWIACSFVMILFLENSVLRRLSRLGHAVSAIARSGRPAAGVSEDGADELGALAREINTMLSALAASDEKVGKLRGLLPICAACKKIRDDEGYWHQVEEYVTTHSEAEFTHGICPECSRKLYPDWKGQ